LDRVDNAGEHDSTLPYLFCGLCRKPAAGVSPAVAHRPVTAAVMSLPVKASVKSMSRVAWNFGDDPLWILSGGTDSFGAFGGVGVGVSV
jgi:hypothetical protein